MIISRDILGSKKIGLVAPFKDYNYGTVLQAYALYSLFKKQGVDAEYIDYVGLDGTETLFDKLLLCIKHPILLYNKVFKKQRINPIVSFFSTDEFKPIKEEYDKFIKLIPSSDVTTYRNIKQIRKRYSSFCVGSDQTWSPFVVGPLSINFLPFVKETKKKNSYAPSIGTSQISNSFKKSLKRNLSDFNIITCRDFYGTSILQDILKRDVVNVLDPTLLMTKEDWEPSIKKMELPDNFILCYQLGVKKNLIGFARKISEEKSIPVIIIPTNEYTSSQPESLASVSPGNFLYLVKNAKYVVTDSFHGTLFSINFGTQFFSFSKLEGTLDTFDNIRISELLTSFELSDRFIENSSSIPSDIDYTMVNKQLEERRSISMQVLKKISETALED